MHLICMHRIVSSESLRINESSSSDVATTTRFRLDDADAIKDALLERGWHIVPYNVSEQDRKSRPHCVELDTCLFPASGMFCKSLA